MKAAEFQRRFGPWAVVTGASSGIGRALALEIAARGVGVVAVGRNGDALDALRRDALGDVRPVIADLSTAEGRRTVADATRTLDVGLFAPAAGFGTSGRFLAADLADELEMIQVNCLAVLEQTHHFARRMAAERSDRGGAIVLFSSIVAFQGVPGAATYSATKAWVQSLAEGLRRELARHEIDVLAVAPATVHTAFADRAGMRMGAAATPERVAAATIRAVGRGGTIRPGFMATVLELALKLPRSMRTRIMAKVMGSMVSE